MYNLTLKAMKNLIRMCVVILSLACYQITYAQKSLKEYATKYDSKKIQKGILYDAFSVPATHKSFKDGHGKNPYFTSKDQLPDTIALITFNIRDLGDVNVTDAGYVKITTYTALSENGGNQVSNEIYDLTINMLRERFKKEGVVLLTPKEFLNTKEKSDFYYDKFNPDVSKLGNFLRNIENRGTQMASSADFFRTFDLGAAADWRRSTSLGYDLANKLEVDAVLSIGTALRSNKKGANMRYMAIALHGPNLIPKQDKKYIAQKAGNGYNKGQLYTSLKYILKNEIKTLTIQKKEITDINFDGYEVILEELIDRMYKVFDESIAKAQK
jgi:hypothetical protein